MRTIKRTSKFRQDFKRELKGRHQATIIADFLSLSQKVENDQPLDTKFKDHALSGNWKNHRDCHIRPDLVLIYKKADDNKLTYVRLGSHSELGL